LSAPVVELWARRLIDATSLTKGQTFLDVGGGDGALCAAIESLSGAIGAVVDPAVDPSTAAPNRVRGTAEALPFPDADFDVVLFNHVAHMLKRPVVALREAARVVSPGGRISVRFSSPQNLQKLPLARWDPEGFEALASRAPTISRILTWGKRAGLGMSAFDLVSTPFAGTYEQWIAGMSHIVEQAWLESGCRGSVSPVAAFEAVVRRAYISPEPFEETLLVFTRPYPPNA
jgi:ubiquinone/menaquinone biosynthesis C-methylase UbiE